MTRNVAEKVAATKVYSKQCNGFYDCQYDGKALRNAWAAPVYSYSDVKAPYSYEAEISGFEGGFDVQSDVYNRLGVFASYRQACLPLIVRVVMTLMVTVMTTTPKPAPIWISIAIS